MGHRTARTAVVACFISAALMAAIRPTILRGSTPQYVALFVLGMCGAAIVFSEDPRLEFWRDRVPWSVLAWLGVAITVAGIFAIGLVESRPRGGSLRAADRVRGRLPTRRYVDRRPGKSCDPEAATGSAVFVGTFSYSLYLIHAPLLQVAWQYGVEPLHESPGVAFLLMLAFAVPPIVALSFVFFLVAERPFLNTKPVYGQHFHIRGWRADAHQASDPETVVDDPYHRHP